MPKVTKFGSDRLVNFKIEEYRVDWNRKVSAPQLKVKKFLYPFWRYHVVTEEARIPGSLLRIDLMNWSTLVCVEISPSGSHSYNKFFHKSKANYGAAVKRELGKADWLERNGFTLCEIFDEDMEKLSPEWFEETYGVIL